MISERLQSLRKEKGLTKQAISNETGIKYSTYANYESGLREPNSEALITLAEYYMVSIDYILGRTDDRTFIGIDNVPGWEEGFPYAIDKNGARAYYVVDTPEQRPQSSTSPLIGKPAIDPDSLDPDDILYAAFGEARAFPEDDRQAILNVIEAYKAKNKSKK